MAKNIERYVPYPYWIGHGRGVSDAAESGVLEYFYPKNGLHARELEFEVKGNSEQVIHPNSSYLKVRGVLSGETARKNDAGDAIKLSTADNDVAIGFVNNILGSLIESIEVRLNDVDITKTEKHYSYLSYLDSLLNYGKDAKETTMPLIGWASDEAGKLEDVASSGFVKRKSLMHNNEIELCGKLFTPLFTQAKIIPSMVSIRLVIKLREPRWYLIHEEGKFSFEIKEVVLMMQKTSVVPAMKDAFNQMSVDNNDKLAILPVKDWRCNPMTIPQSNSQQIFDNVFSGKIPDRVIIGFVDTDAYQGRINRNPYNFQHFDLAEICMYKDGMPFPRPLIKMDIRNKQYVDAFHHFLTSIRARYNRNTPGITANDYMNGTTLFSYDMSVDQLGSMSLGNELPMNSNIRIVLRFHRQLEKSITMLIFSQTNGLIEITKNYQVTTDY